LLEVRAMSPSKPNKRRPAMPATPLARRGLENASPVGRRTCSEGALSAALDVLVEKSGLDVYPFEKGPPIIASSYLSGKRMADVEWRPLATLRPEPAVWTDVGELMLLMFTQDGANTGASRRNFH
jgi:hypothetical protein